LRIVHFDELPVLPISSEKLKNWLGLPKHCTDDERVDYLFVEATNKDDRLIKIRQNPR